jgi:hypothetical protein
MILLAAAILTHHRHKRSLTMQVKTPHGTREVALDPLSMLTNERTAESTRRVFQTAMRVDLERYLREWSKANPEVDPVNAISEWYPGLKMAKPAKPLSPGLRKQIENLTPEARAELLRELSGA